MNPVKPDPIAIVGLSCRFPEANNVAEFWEMLLEGRDTTRPLPASRHFMRPTDWDPKELGTPAGYLKCAIEEFDAKFFGISRREAEFMDPQQRLLLEVSWEALENAGVDPHSLRGSDEASVYVGIWTQEYSRLVPSETSQDYHFQYLGNALCAASARISHFLGTRGPSITFEAGCASALEAIHYACESLRAKDADLVISGGVNVALNGGGGDLAGFASHVLAKDGKCKTYDKAANGFARGEAAVVFILKRLSDAVRDGNDVLGLLLGGAVNSDGAGTSMGTPNAEAQERLLKRALRKAGVLPHEVGYIEAHGTGTPVGDPTEFRALNAVFGNDPKRVQPLWVASIKTNIGHTEGAAGASGLAKVLLAMRHRTMPRHLHLRELNPHIDLSVIPAVIPTENAEWMPCSAERGLVAGVSSFGLSGTNAHMLVQEPPKLVARQPPIMLAGMEDRRSHILVLSAASEVALAELAERYAELLETQPSLRLADVAFSANTGRAHLGHRAALLAEDSAEAASRLRSGHFLQAKLPASALQEAPESSVKVAFLFTGQGSQYAGMAKELYDSSAVFRASFDRCAGVLLNNYGLDLAHVLSYSSPSTSERLLDESAHSQPAICCIEICVAELWASWGISPHYVVGHSVGEFAAAVVAGLLSLEDGLKLVMERSRLVSRLPPGAMLVVKTTRDATQRLIADFEAGARSWIDIAAVNSGQEVVVSGSPESIVAFEALCKSAKGGSLRTQRLAASHAFHSRAMGPVLEEWGCVASTVHAKYGANSTRIRPKFVSGTRAREMEPAELNAEYWVAHLREAVNWTDAFEGLRSREACNAWVEVGPQPVLLGLGMGSLSVEAANRATWVPSIRQSGGNWSTMLTGLARLYLAGAKVDWAGFDAGYDRRRVTRALPNYPWQRERYWIGDAVNGATSDSLKVSSRLLHPLLGRRVPSPRTELATYHNTIRLSTLPWLREHQVADTPIVPAAAQLEIVLAAGRDLVGGPTASGSGVLLCVEGLRVECALPLNEVAPTHIQTLVNTVMCAEGGGDGDGAYTQLKYSVSIHKQTLFDSSSGSDPGTWRRLVSAIFVPGASILPTLTQSVDLEAMRQELEGCSEAEVEETYSRWVELGLFLGPHFRLVRRLWLSETVVLLETDRQAAVTPERGHTDDKYVFHPILMDVLVQSPALAYYVGSKGAAAALSTLRLPVSIDRFVSSPRGVVTDRLYVRLETGKREGKAWGSKVPRLTMYNDRGEFLFTMEGVEYATTTTDAFLRSLDTDAELYPTFYDEAWLPRLSIEARRFQLLPVAGVECESVAAAIPALDDRLLNVVGYAHHARQMVYFYVLRALAALWGVGDSCASIQQLAARVSIPPRNLKLLRRFFQILEEEGDVRFDEAEEDKVHLAKGRSALPSQQEVDTDIQVYAGHFRGDEAGRSECQFIVKFGENLLGLLQGKVSPFSLLFPEQGSDAVGAAALYRTAYVLEAHKCAGLHLSAWLLAAVPTAAGLDRTKDGRGPVLRILEVGGGTGSTTEHILKELEEVGVPYEYTFTDISPLFLQMAAERFGVGPASKNMKFKLLDIEADPKHQGFVPHSFDVVVADMVLHATRYLRDSLRNTRHLLAPHGLLLLVEIVHRFRMLDISFGFTDGWWRFEDKTEAGPRTDHPCISAGEWVSLLREDGLGFAKAGFVKELEPLGVLGVVTAQADGQGATRPALLPASGNEGAGSIWLLLGTSTHPLTAALKKRLESVGERALVVSELRREENSYAEMDVDGGHCAIRLCEKEDFRRLIQQLAGRKLKLAGVVHLLATEGVVGMERDVDMWAEGALPPTPEGYDAILGPLVEGLLTPVQTLLEEAGGPLPFRVYLVTCGMQSLNPASDPITANPYPAALVGLMTALNNVPDVGPSPRFVCIDVPVGAVGGSLEGDSANRDPDPVARAICDELWLQEADTQIVLRTGGAKYVKRMTRAKPYVHSIPLPCTDRHRLENPGNGNLTELAVVPAARVELGDDHVEVQIKAASLNFKDLLVALSPVLSAPSSEQNMAPPAHMTGLGMDFSGVVSRAGPHVKRFRVGDRVFGVTSGALGGSLASHVVVPHFDACRMPDGASFETCAALPVVLLTVHYFLVQKAGLRKGDKILIHCAAGGVGLLAVRVAQRLGAEVYATAGSQRKRTYLRRFCGVKHVFGSRDTNFLEAVLRATGGVGVDVVLNALTSPGFKEASLAACAPAARFMELSKLNIWTDAEVAALRLDVLYVWLQVDGLEPAVILGQLGSLEEAYASLDGLLGFDALEQSLPLTRFTYSRVHEAFRYMQLAKHIGKVVVKMPSTAVEGGRIVHREDLFNVFGSYLITGGLGGIGLEVATWMAGSGARYLVLVSRSAATPEAAAQARLDQLRSRDVQLLVLVVDVCDYAQCARLPGELRAAGFPPLRGVMHAAGVLFNREIAQQTTEDFLTAFRPKVHGTWNLHALTLRERLSLDHFVLFSSAASSFGGHGQSNYAAANRYLDAFAAYRQGLGLPCASIGWGPWSDVGMVSAVTSSLERLTGLRSFTPTQGIASLQRVLLDHCHSAVVNQVPSWALLMQHTRQGALFDLVKDEASRSVPNASWLDRRIARVRAAGPKDREEQVRDFIELVMRDTLRLSDSEVIDGDADLRTMGLDSLMAMEIRSKVHQLLEGADDEFLSTQALLENNTLNKLSRYATAVLSGMAAAGELSPEQLLQLVKKDCVLPEDIVVNGGPPSPSLPSQFRHVLLTGATGQLGVFLLHELTTRRPDLVVHCLVRAESEEAARDRLETSLEDADLLETTSLVNVTCVAGSVTSPRFGLSEETYTALSQQVDGVLHAAALCNHVLPYAEHGAEDLRSTNVTGLLNVLRFGVATRKVKWVQHASTVFAALCEREGAGGEAPLESFAPAGCWGEAFFQNGYTLSKFVGEELCQRAMEERGLPVAVVRHHYLSADTQSGLHNARNSNYLLATLASRRVGLFPDMGMALTMVPVDVSARVAVSLFLHDDLQPGLYTINNPATTTMAELMGHFQAQGRDLRLVPYEEWRKALLESEQITELASLADVYVPDLLSSDLLGKSSLIVRMRSERPALQNSDRLKRLVPDVDALMPTPFDLIKFYIEKFEATFGKNNLAALLQPRPTA